MKINRTVIEKFVCPDCGDSNWYLKQNGDIRCSERLYPCKFSGKEKDGYKFFVKEEVITTIYENREEFDIDRKDRFSL